MRKTVTMDANGRELFEAMQKCIVERNASHHQTLCAISELFLWVLLVIHDGDERATVEQFDAMGPNIREAIRMNAPYFESIGAKLRGALQ